MRTVSCVEDCFILITWMSYFLNTAELIITSVFTSYGDICVIFAIMILTLTDIQGVLQWVRTGIYLGGRRVRDRWRQKNGRIKAALTLMDLYGVRAPFAPMTAAQQCMKPKSWYGITHVLHTADTLQGSKSVTAWHFGLWPVDRLTKIILSGIFSNRIE